MNATATPSLTPDAMLRWDTCAECRAGLESLGAVSPPGPHRVELGGCDVHRDACGPQATHVVNATRAMVDAWKVATPPAPPVDRWVQRHSLLVAEMSAHMLGAKGLSAKPADIEHAVSQARAILIEAAKGGERQE